MEDSSSQPHGGPAPQHSQQAWRDPLGVIGSFIVPSSASNSTASSSTRPPAQRTDSTDRKRRLTSAEHGRTYPYTAPGNNRSNPVDLTNSSPTQAYHVHSTTDRSSLTSPPRRSSRMSGTDIHVPAWEPDSAVSKCPVCEQEFGIFFRKHHCRKCGRVVCSTCSPHRITIPGEYIVQPPPCFADAPGYVGGAEVVRVCKPCVPDPWTPDVQPLTGQGISRRSLPPVPPRDASLPPRPPHPPHPPHHTPRPSVSFSPQTSGYRQPPSPYRPVSTPQGPVNLPWVPPPPPRRFSYGRPLPPPPPPPLPPPQSQSQSQSQPIPSSHTPRTAPPQPRRQVKEEDECPVCGIELPPGQTIREEHVQACVMSRFGPADSSMSPRRESPAAMTASSSTPPGTPNRARAQSYRSRGVFPYIATEKDCLDGEGREQECPICMEEFQPGDEMGRLECLCKFHRRCIREWWSRKGPGMCPVHVSHD